MDAVNVLLLAMLFGLKHALDLDHVIAVSNIVSEKRKVRFSALVGAWWGAGHMTTILVIGCAIIYFNLLILKNVEKLLEGFVGVMFIVLGIQAVFSIYKRKSEVAVSKAKSPYMLKSFTVGLLHGLAGSSAVAYVFLSTIEDKSLVFLYLILFGVGTLLSMVLATLIIGLPYSLASNHKRVNTVLACGTGFLSIGFGIFYIYEILMQ
ncbi:hypothetical protein ACFFIX_11600 [Metabacillus herbersteinensis]|uniref:Urease accessory protein UreH n=1 Tax=Metabacillus herbersteinensis TaxID=283816 RepID=A0ABV6GEJ8_9BACI